MRIFYSWQSDLPNRTNRGLIEDALRGAFKQIQRDGDLDVVPALDRDTQGEAGTPDIARTIFEKIDQAEVFLADASLINRRAIDEYGMRPTPNPNVLVELGYAARSLGWERMIVVVNTAHGAVEELPFDIRARRVVTYRLADDEKPGAARQELAAKLAVALSPILRQGPTRQASGPDVRLIWRDPPAARRDPFDAVRAEAPFAPLETGRIVLPAPLYPDVASFWRYFEEEQRSAAETSESGWGRRGFGKGDAEHFRKNLSDPRIFADWYVDMHWRHGVIRVHIDLTNAGTVPAHDIDVSLSLPEWLRSVNPGQPHHDSLTTRWPFDYYKYSQYSYGRGPGGHAHSAVIPSHRPAFFFQEDREIGEQYARRMVVHQLELLHTYTLPSRWPLQLIALPGAPAGPCELEYEVFCRELPTRARKKLGLVVTSTTREDE